MQVLIHSTNAIIARCCLPEDYKDMHVACAAHLFFLFPLISQILNLWYYCCYSHCKCRSSLLADGRKHDEGDDDDDDWLDDNNDDDDNAWIWGWWLLRQRWGSQKWPRLLSWQTRKQEMKSSSKTYLISSHFIIPIIRISVFRNTLVHTSLKEKLNTMETICNSLNQCS